MKTMALVRFLKTEIKQRMHGSLHWTGIDVLPASIPCKNAHTSPF